MANLSAVINDDLKAKLEKIAERDHRSLSNVISIILSQGVNTYEKKMSKHGPLQAAPDSTLCPDGHELPGDAVECVRLEA